MRKNKLQWTVFDYIFNVISILTIIFDMFFIFIKISVLPNQIPTNYENDKVISTGSKYNLLFFILINLLFYIFLVLAENFQEKYSQKEHKKINRATTHFISIMKLEITSIITILSIFASYSVILKQYVFVIFILIIVISLLIYSFYIIYKNIKKVPKVKKNREKK